MKYASYILSAIVMALPLTFNMCGPMYAQHGKVASLRETAKTFYQMAADNGENGPPPAVYKTREIIIQPEVTPKCNHGELDLINAAMKCNSQAPLIVTYKDLIGEIQVFKFDLQSGQNFESLLSWLTVPIPRQIAGDKLDLFVCLDGNFNGRCADEPIVDINNATAQVLATGVNALPAIFCAQMKAGAVLFHSRHNLSDIAGATTATVNNEGAAGAVQQSLQNLNNEGPPPSAPPGQAVTFPVKLVKYEAGQCPPPAVRNDGCFIKGTKINISKDVAIEIEKLNAGQNVLLADGRKAKIQRVIAGPEHKPVVAFETENGLSLTVTNEHPLMTKAGMKLAKDITIGDELKTADGKLTAITSIAKKKYTDNVYNFELAGTPKEADHSVIANGIVSGELYLQNLMSGKGRSDNVNVLTSR